MVLGCKIHPDFLLSALVPNAPLLVDDLGNEELVSWVQGLHKSE